MIRPIRGALLALALAATVAGSGVAGAQESDAPPRAEQGPAPDVNAPEPVDVSKRPTKADFERGPVRVIVEMPGNGRGPDFGEEFLHGPERARWRRGVLPEQALEGLERAGARVILDELSWLDSNGTPASIHTGAVHLQNAGHDGTNKFIAVVDSGVDTNHPQLWPRVQHQSCFAADNLCPGGTTVAHGPGTGEPCAGGGQCWHGTAVAGAAASSTRGTAPDALVWSMKAFFDRDGNGPQGASSYTSDQAAAFSYARSQMGALASAGTPLTVVNLSGGGGGPYNSPCSGTPVPNEIDALYNAGVHVTVAAGNDGFNNGVAHPACTEKAYTVGSVVGDPGNSDAIVASSNTGWLLDQFAPGQATLPVPGGGEGYTGGTSFAAPFMAGILLDLAESHPTMGWVEREAAARVSGPILQDDSGYGRRRIDATEARDRLTYRATQTFNTRLNTPIPFRVYDSRMGIGTPNVGKLGNGSTTWVNVAAALGLQPNQLEAVSINLTVTDADQPGWVAAWDSGPQWPGHSNVNVNSGQAISNAAYVKTSQTDGHIQFLNGSGNANVIIDVTGFWGPSSDFEPLTPSRIVNTVVAPGGRATVFPGGQGGVPVGADAVVLNVTTLSNSAGYTSVLPSGNPVTVSTQNFTHNETLAAQTVVKLSGGAFDIYNGTSTNNQILADVVGYVWPGAQDLVAITPVRAVDTRLGSAVGSGWFLIDLAPAGLPSNARSVTFNYAAVGPNSNTYLSTAPGVGLPPSPQWSNVNVAAGDTLANQVTLQIGSDGDVRGFNANGATHVLVDVTGWAT